MGKGNKHPNQKFQPQETKEPRTAARLNYSKLTWSFSILDRGGPFGWSLCDSKEKYLEIIIAKGQFEQMTPTELGYRKCHSVKVAQISSEAKARLTEIKLDDLENLYSFKLTNLNRIWCIQDGSIMRVLWWDPEHKVFPSTKRDN